MSAATAKSRWLRWTGYVVFAVVFAIACWWLSQWQFDRNEWRAGNNAVIEQNYDASPVPFDHAVDVASAVLPTDEEWLRVTVTGTYVRPESPIFVRNRPHAGSNAFDVLQPLRTAAGTLVIVNRGWVPPGDTAQPAFVPVAPPGEVTVVGHMRPSEAELSARRGADAGQVANINLDAVAELSGTDTYLGGYIRAESEMPAAAEKLGGFERPSTDAGPHLSYAIQWILFAVMGFGFIAYVIRSELHNYREGKDLNADRKKRRRDTDAEAEDALLDGSGSSGAP